METEIQFLTLPIPRPTYILYRLRQMVETASLNPLQIVDGDGLLLSGGRKWDRNRRLLTPAFHVEILKNYVKIFNASIRILSQKWSSVVEPVDVFHHISLLTLDNMMKCLFGYESNCQNETRKFRRACNTIHLHSEQIIGSRRQLLQREKPNSRNVDFLDILLTAKDSEGKGLTNDEIRDEVDTFMFEGHDSTASAISWCLYNLAKYPEHQDRCREEILSVIGNKRDPEW
ncbi:hypothetical protein CHS0354_024265 [Potamilus streckersoni]|uniref:Cytochrome P450 n=1 Tax=Potamilus streckersoni TaxID=2493646 RepID=A0AAE0VY67_9BIVA|nr:hypothetical protein CHS0354_024265 [Potamilus streckersoni]